VKTKSGKRKLPKGWRWIRLGEVGLLVQGGTPSTEIEDYWHGQIPFVTGADVTSLHVERARSFLTEKGISSGKTEECKKGDLLVVSRTRVGRVGIAGVRLAISQDVSVVKVSSGFSSEYLALCLRSLSHELENACQGATIKGLTRSFLEHLEIPLPATVDEQLAIAAELERKLRQVESMRLAAARQLEAFSALPGAILREAFDFEP